MTTPDERRVDDLRERLRSLGYLDAGVDRFVLGGGAKTRPLALLASASMRIGLMAGALLGPAAVIGLHARAPGLVTGPADGVVLALYLGAVFGLAATGLVALAILTGGVLARRSATRANVATRASRIASSTGLLIGLACLTYLVLWWRTAVGAGPLPMATTSAMLVAAVAISLLLGHGVTVAVLAWLAYSGVGPALRPGLPLSSYRSLAAIGVIALASGAGMLALTNRAGAIAPAPAITVVPTGERVLVLALDGVDTAMVDRLTAAGRLPRLGGLLSTGAAPLRSAPDRDPARVWTTVATGRPPEQHGIRGLEARQVAGVGGRFRPASPLWSGITAATDLVRLTRPAVASGDERLIPAFWEVAARAGFRTAVIHWWATWPAPPDLGVVLSDRAILRLEQGGELAGEIAPAALYDTLRLDWGLQRRRAADLAGQAVPDAPGDIADTIRRSAELDATLINLAADPALGPLDLLVLYLPGLDIAQHALLGAERAGAMPASAAADRLATLERYYEFLDRALAPLLLDDGALPPLVITVAQPGRVTDPAGGILAVRAGGPGGAAGSLDTTAVASTVLYALGVPVAQDLASGPALALFPDAFVMSHPPATMPTYGSVRSQPRAGKGRALDREMIERMRSLGYLR
jgi:hypothetical protein